MREPTSPLDLWSEGVHTRGYLPHLKVAGGTYFVTFRLAGSLPREILAALQDGRRILDNRLRRASPDEREALRRLRDEQAEQVERLLDAGCGDCWLSRAPVAQVVTSALRHFDGRRYQLHAWVVMPNHVHAVVTPLNGITLSRILHSWKSYSANQANRLLGRPGQPFWQHESYDHLVRDDADLARCCEYILQNPVAARLCTHAEDWPFSGPKRVPE